MSDFVSSGWAWYVAALFVGGLVGLGYSWLVQHRLDTLDGVHQHVVPAPGR